MLFHCDYIICYIRFVQKKSFCGSWFSNGLQVFDTFLGFVLKHRQTTKGEQEKDRKGKKRFLGHCECGFCWLLFFDVFSCLVRVSFLLRFIKHSRFVRPQTEFQLKDTCTAVCDVEALQNSIRFFGPNHCGAFMIEYIQWTIVMLHQHLIMNGVSQKPYILSFFPFISSVVASLFLSISIFAHLSFPLLTFRNLFKARTDILWFWQFFQIFFPVSVKSVCVLWVCEKAYKHCSSLRFSIRLVGCCFVVISCWCIICCFFWLSFYIHLFSQFSLCPSLSLIFHFAF